MTVRFVVDAQLPPALAQYLADYGLPARHVSRIGLGVAPDAEIWAYAVQHQAVLVTKDEDFVQLARRSAPGTSVVWLRLGNITNRALWRALEPVLPEVISALEAGDRVVEIA
jgi:predicted nuclease of predicted toxin-antitoxin system